MSKRSAVYCLLLFAGGAVGCLEHPEQQPVEPRAVNDSAAVNTRDSANAVDVAEAEREPDGPLPSDALDAEASAKSERPDVGMSATSSSLDAGSSVSSASSEAGPTVVTPVLPRVTLARAGALGFCIQPGMLLNATVEVADEGSGSKFSGRFPGACDTANCPGNVPLAARRLSAVEMRGLAALLAALPDGQCLAEPSPICDPCLVQHLSVGDRTYYIDPCVPEPCPGFQRAAARLVTFIDNLAAATPRNDTADCYSPSQNLARSFEAGASGCACDWEGQGVCVSGNALICETSATGDVARWHAVIDGPCWQRRSCSPATVVGTLELCLREQPLCVGPIEGQFCR